MRLDDSAKVSTQYLGIILDQSGLYIIQLNASLKVTYANQSILDFINSFTKRNPQDFLDELLPSMTKVANLLNDRKTLFKKLAHYSTFPLQDESYLNGIKVAWSLYPLISEHHTLESILLIGKKVPNIERKNDKLRMENLIANLPGNVYWMDKNCIHLGCNDNILKMIGITREEYIGKTYEELAEIAGWKNGEIDKFKAADLTVLQSGKPIVGIEEPPLKHKDGRIINYLTTRVPLKNETGEIIGVAGISVDITERKKREEDLKIAKEAAEVGERAKTEFIANVSHDMRTPLSGIVSLTRQVEESLDECPIKDIIVQIADSGDALFDMFVEILDDVAADHMTEKDIEVETFDINRLVDKIAKLEKPSLTNKGLEFIYTIDQTIPLYLVGDRKKIHRIILNLFGNAIKFTKKGHIKIKIELIDQCNENIRLRINVIDTGIGVPNKSKKHLFQRFYKASPSYKGEYKGFGLGLHIAKTYTYLLGGEISFTSEEGKGSDFYVILPLKIATEKEIKLYNNKLKEKKSALLKAGSTLNLRDLKLKKELPEEKENDAKDVRVLIIEDNYIARAMLTNYIKAAKLKYAEADSGETALELIKDQSFDLILTDVGLPGISGTEFAQKLREFEKENNKQPAPIVGITAHAATGRSECLEAGMDAVTAKPLSKETFNEILQEFLPFHKLSI